MASAPDNARLHELLKAAARELKATQQELSDERDLHESARKSLDQERARAKELNEKLLDLQQALRKAQGQLAELERLELTDRRPVVGATRPGPDGQTSLPPTEEHAEDRTNVSRLDPELLELRVKALEESLAESEAEVKQHRQRVAALEGELVTRAPGPAGPDSSAVERDANERHLADVEERLAGVEAELDVTRERLSSAQERASVMGSELAEARAQLRSEQARSGDVLARHAALEAQLAQGAARVAVLEREQEAAAARAEGAEARVAEQGQRQVQLEADLAVLRARRDELNVELGRAESERKKLMTKLSELEAGLQTARDDEAKARADLETRHADALAQVEAKRAEAEGQASREKEKHQLTVQRLVEARQRIRDVETQLAEAQGKLDAAAKAREQREADHAAELARLREAHHAELTTRQAATAQLEKELAHASGELQHLNRQYEQLHREMLQLLDQRDEARRQLQQLQGR
ncbi:MAG: hypothetical protein INH41_07535 [Myxococcaceae bacterium]|jgi:chromosome segregation ATPase|nr:hypothetical protein [Myxococcaceae bacterium]MCA3012237.1 hypothetical protein [Myxococcaceae bacterium]